MWTNKDSVYTLKFDDEMGIFFTEENFPELKEQPEDVGPVLEKAIKKLIDEQIFGNLYIPSGEYPIKSTVKIPPSVRLIGYGETRPLFYVPEDGGALDSELPEEKEKIQESFFEGYPGAQYMFWFIGERDLEKETPRDANAGTFYSAISNINFGIRGSHPHVICLRAHFAQHGFINHCHFDLGQGLAAIYDVGNEMEDLTVEGGEYGIICRMTSPGWPFAMLDSTFMNQRSTAILTGLTGFTGFRLRILNTKRAFDLYIPGAWEKLYLEDCVFSNISEATISFGNSSNVVQQTNLKDIYCDKVHTLIHKIDTEDKVTKLLGRNYVVRDYVSGYIYSDGDKEPKFSEICDIEPYKGTEKLSEYIPESDIPALPPMESWVNVRKYGVVADGEADDTKALQEAIDKEEILYFPQGVYRITDTLNLRKKNTLIGLHPMSTEITLKDDEEAFAGFGTPKPMIDTMAGSEVVINGIGIDTLGKNPRACGVKWCCSEKSYMNDVKFLGGHGYMRRDGVNAYTQLYNPTRTGDYDVDKRWDFQYSSLWVANGGGGIFKDIWSCSPYAEAGIMITDTSAYGRMYAISLEHHVRHEIKLRNVSNFKIFALQTEEEKGEGLACLPMEIVGCSDLEFVNYYLFRVVAVDKNFDDGVRIYDSKNICFKNYHNKAQMQFTFPVSVRDMTSGFAAKSSDYARLTVNGKEPARIKEKGITKLAEGFDFLQGAALDSKGNLYFCEKLSKSIYKIDAVTRAVSPVISIHFIPSAVQFDSRDNMLVAVDYSALQTTKPGSIYQTHDLKNFHPFFSWFKDRSERMYTCNPDRPYETMQELKVEDLPLAGKTIVRPGELDYPGMFDRVMDREVKEFYVAPDGETLIEKTVDLARSIVLTKFVPGYATLVTDDAGRYTREYGLSADGEFTSGDIVATRGQYGAYKDSNGVVWTIEDRLYGFKEGKQVKAMDVPEDAHSLVGYNDKLYIIGRHGVYSL